MRMEKMDSRALTSAITNGIIQAVGIILVSVLAAIVLFAALNGIVSLVQAARVLNGVDGGVVAGNTFSLSEGTRMELNGRYVNSAVQCVGDKN